MLKSAKKRAIAKSLPFAISEVDVVIPAKCPILGCDLTWGGLQSTSASIDRIVPELGYVPNNIQVVSHLANRMKNSATTEQLLRFANWVLSCQ